MGATGEAGRIKFNPRDSRPRDTPAEDGEYTLSLGKVGERGIKGYKVRAGGQGKKDAFPYRTLFLDILGTESETRAGECKQLMMILSTNPKAYFTIWDFAKAVGYPDDVDLPTPEHALDTPKVREYMDVVDSIVFWAHENDRILRVELSTEEYKGEPVNRVKKYLPPPDSEDGSSDASAGEEEPEAEEVEEKPKPAPAKGKGKGKKW